MILVHFPQCLCLTENLLDFQISVSQKTDPDGALSELLMSINNNDKGSHNVFLQFICFRFSQLKNINNVNLVSEKNDPKHPAFDIGTDIL